MAQQTIAVAEILMALEKELRELHLWGFETPSETALASTEPFAIDTLNFTQWLQFIFIPRLYFMVERDLPLPRNSGVAPMAEEYFQGSNVNSDTVILYLRNIDKLLSES